MDREKITSESEERGIVVSKHSIIIAIPILIAIMITYYKNDNANVYYNLIEIFCATLGAALSIIAIIRKDATEGKIYKYIGYGYLFLGLVTFMKIILNSIDGAAVSVHFVGAINILTYVLEYLVILGAFILNKYNSTLIKSIYAYSILTVLIFGSVYLFSAISYVSIGKSGIVKFSSIIIFVLAVCTFIAVYRDKTNLTKEDKVHLVTYLFFIICYQCLRNANLIWLVDCNFEIGIFKYVSYYVMYECLAKFLLNIPFDNMKKNLEKAQIMQANLNNILSNRNKSLIETKSVIEKSERRYANLIESINDGIMIFYFERLSYINNSAKDILNCKVEQEVIGKNFFAMLIELIPKQVIEAEFDIGIEYIDYILLEDKKIYKMGNIKGKSIDYEVYLFKIDGRNKIIYIKDISIVNKNYELRKEYTEYLKEEKLKNEFYSNISHELRTPINLIYSALQLNEIYLKDGNLENINKSNLAIKQNCLRLIRTINNFIDTNKIGEGFIDPIINSMNIVSVVENISLACNKYIELSNSYLTFDSTAEEIYGKCDRDMLERVILNLLSNCIKYGGKNGAISVNIYEEDKWVLIKVTNSGYKIDEEIHPYIFDKFTKINKSLRREKEGSGLGLFLCKALIEIQNGTLELKQNEKNESEFNIKLPKSTREERTKRASNFAMNPLEEKVDIEFADIYL